MRLVPLSPQGQQQPSRSLDSGSSFLSTGCWLETPGLQLGHAVVPGERDSLPQLLHWGLDAMLPSWGWGMESGEAWHVAEMQ